MADQTEAERIGSLVQRILALAPAAGLYVSIRIEPARDGRRAGGELRALLPTPRILTESPDHD